MSGDQDRRGQTPAAGRSEVRSGSEHVRYSSLASTINTEEIPMGISVDTRHALKNSLGEKSGNEIIRLLDCLSDEMKAEEDFKKAKLDKVAGIAASAVKLNEGLVNPSATVTGQTPVQPPSPPVVKAVASTAPVITPVIPDVTSSPASVVDESSEHDAPV